MCIFGFQLQHNKLDLVSLQESFPSPKDYDASDLRKLDVPICIVFFISTSVSLKVLPKNQLFFCPRYILCLLFIG